MFWWHGILQNKFKQWNFLKQDVNHGIEALAI